jgi:hypothetical protein
MTCGLNLDVWYLSMGSSFPARQKRKDRPASLKLYDISCFIEPWNFFYRVCLPTSSLSSTFPHLHTAILSIRHSNTRIAHPSIASARNNQLQLQTSPEPPDFTIIMSSDASAPLFSTDLISPEVLKQLPEGYGCRPIQQNDYHKGFLDVLRVLTTVGDVTEEVISSPSLP